MAGKQVKVWRWKDTPYYLLFFMIIKEVSVE
jgi:hypothetical protein